MRSETVSVLQLTLHDELIAYVSGFRHGRNILSFADSFRLNADRPTFSLTTHPAFPGSEKMLSKTATTHQRLHPILSNLLPEGALRDWLAQGLKVHPDNEFALIAHLGDDLPGALKAHAVEPSSIPEFLRFVGGEIYPVAAFELQTPSHKFSLAGVQMKFSMKELEGRFTLAGGSSQLGDWIVKPPSPLHPDLPLNEYTAMRLAALAEVEIPEIRLIPIDKLSTLPDLNLPNETFAYGIKRFDRKADLRIHMEDFAQVLLRYPHEKYSGANYEHIGRILAQFSADGLADTQQFARRLLVNILLANGDAHLKNWSLLYPDQRAPRLSPAYDIVTTLVYIEQERSQALNLGRNKVWAIADLTHFERWAEKSGVSWRSIKPHLHDVMDKARTLWPTALNDLPMNPGQKAQLRQHWKSLQPDFRIETP